MPRPPPICLLSSRWATRSPDTVICIIEAMKVMNEVKAEKSGVVKEIVAQNGQPVEYGQILMVLE